MSKLVLSSFFVLILLFFVAFAASFEYLTVASSDNKTSVDNITRNAMTQAVNWGEARVNEEITIDKEVATEAVLRQYAASSDFYDGNRSLGIYAVNENQAMIAVDIYSQLDTPMQHMVNNFKRKQELTDSVIRNRNAVIYEAKALSKPYATQMAGSH